MGEPNQIRWAVVAYPKLADEDRRWIESIRDRHDPQAKVLAAHFTVVFPVLVLFDVWVGDIAGAARTAQVIHFRLGPAKAVPDALARGGHIYLPAVEGTSELLELHDRCYSGTLEPQLRPEIPYEPHVTIGACDDLVRCREIAADMNCAERTIVGSIEALDIVQVKCGTVSTAQRFKLGTS